MSTKAQTVMAKIHKFQLVQIRIHGRKDDSTKYQELQKSASPRNTISKLRHLTLSTILPRTTCKKNNWNGVRLLNLSESPYLTGSLSSTGNMQLTNSPRIRVTSRLGTSTNKVHHHWKSHNLSNMATRINT